ncbi:zinc ABC transporter ATP-binding protein AztA [Blastochloris viridis]|uniref:Iron(3+)-hydroxamate import ATP-binding protein FhuC n=1 Tax=Blastochloris viridis TaxID=1079 RepID=A0A0H5BQ72_BLAVI|nr:zinc ABC transporter ATP-binding protein AztA [Blastochloris viridis]ALK09663.1 Iron(3+)-hydroxamate import ATP-binding protein FhuC [Blastochloris viridis]BAS00449.1 zinc ABC transporter [Blastochloris viridis]CUU42326.1 Iron(3+)-hydroxamate import ATP-binding protein FhuC [Blastochloris viridis]
MSVLTFCALTLGYERHPAVHHLTGSVAVGELLAVVGPNGAGKSTLLKGIAGALKPLEGRVDRAGLKARDVAFLPQIAELDRSFPIAVYDMVAMGLWRRTGLFGAITAADRDRIKAAIAAVGLEGFEKRAIGTLSGGQMQRTLFARLLLQDAKLILLDEPFTAIDARTAADLMALVKRWHHEQRTVLAVLHDLEAVKANFPTTLLLAREAIAWGPTHEVLTPDNMRRAQHITEAWDDRAGVCERAA